MPNASCLTVESRVRSAAGSASCCDAALHAADPRRRLDQRRPRRACRAAARAAARRLPAAGSSGSGGGKGANQAVAAARAGGARRRWSARSATTSYGAQALDELREEGIDVSAVLRLAGRADGRRADRGRRPTATTRSLSPRARTTRSSAALVAPALAALGAGARLRARVVRARPTRSCSPPRRRLVAAAARSSSARRRRAAAGRPRATHIRSWCRTRARRSSWPAARARRRQARRAAAPTPRRRRGGSPS